MSSLPLRLMVAVVIRTASARAAGSRSSMPVLANDFIYLPSADGTIVKLATGDGSVVSSINPGYAAAANTRNAHDMHHDLQHHHRTALAELSNTTPPTRPCGSPRVGLNVALAIAPDGSIYTVARLHLRSRYSYLLGVNPNLTPK